MRVFKNRAFSRFADRNDITDEDLCDAVQRATRGLIDADLGGGVVKQRIARKGEGKSGGFRSMILFKEKNRAVFVHGFAKKDLGNVSPKELKALKKLVENHAWIFRRSAHNRARFGNFDGGAMPWQSGMVAA